MKHATKKLLSLVLVAMVLIGVFAVTTHADEYPTITPENDPLIYSLNQKGDGTAEAFVTGWDAPQKDIFIPKTVQGYPVTQIRGAFLWDDTLETVTFEDDSNVMWIDKSFVGCSNLKEINWGSNPALVEIYQSFSECVALEELTIPNTVEFIGRHSFRDCYNLKSLTFEEGSRLEKIAYFAFSFSFDWDEEILPATISELTLPASLEHLDGSAFQGIPVEHFALEDNSRLIEIPDGFLAADGDLAKPGVNTDAWGFWDYVLDLFEYIGESVGRTPEAVAKACNTLLTVDLGENNALTRIGMGAFKNQTHLTDIDFGTGENDLEIARGAFGGVGNNAYQVEQGEDELLNEGIDLVLPANLTQLHGSAFDLARVKTLVIRDNSKLQAIDDGFLEVNGTGHNARPGYGYVDGAMGFVQDSVQIASNCLESITLGENNSLEYIGAGAFKNQNHLKSIDFGTSAVDLTIGTGAFIGMNNNAYLVENGVDDTLNACIETLVFPANLAELGTGAFEATRVKNIVFSDGSKLAVIPNNFMGLVETGNNGHPGHTGGTNGTFKQDNVQLASNCVESVDFGENNSLTLIGFGAFKNQSHLKSIDFGTSNLDLTIENGAFIGAGNNGYLVDQGVDEELNEGIETLVFPANLVKLNYGAFEMARVKNLVFSDNCKLSEIPSGFMGMIGIGNNGYPGQSYSWNYETNSTTYEFVRDGAQLAANSLESVDFGENNSLTLIGLGAFKNQSHLKSIDFGTSNLDLTIAEGAFIGAGNNGYLVDQGVDKELNEGIETLVLPANLVRLGSGGHTYGGQFEMARIKNLVFSDNCKLSEIPSGFMGMIGIGNNGYPGQYNTDTFVRDGAQLAANSLESVDFGENNSLTLIGSGAFKNQSYLKSIDFGTSEKDLTIQSGVFIGAGNNGYLVDVGVDAERSEGIDTLVFPANLVQLNTGDFEAAQIKHIVFADNGKLREIPGNFMGMIGTGCNAQTGRNMLGYNEETHEPIEEFVWDSVQIFAASLESVSFGENNSLTQIGFGAFKNQSHLKSVDFGTSEKDLTIQSGVFIGAGNNGYLVEQGVDQTLNSGIDTLVLPANLVQMYGGGQFELARIKHIVFADNCKLTTVPEGFLQVTGPNGEPREELTYAAANYLKSVDFGENNSLVTIENGVFTNQENLAEIDFGSCNTLTNLERGALIGLRSLKKLDLSNTAITEIAYGVFSESGLTEILLPSSLETLDEGAFQGLTDLRTLTIVDDQQLTKLTGGVFSRCEDLVLVDLLNSNITEIGDAIKENEKLSLIVFPKNLAAITWEIPELEEGQEPLTQEEINKLCTFYGCDNVNKLRFAAADPSGYTFSEGVLQFLSESGTVYVPADTTEAGIQAYKTLLTASGLSFEEGKWTLETVAAEDLEKVQAMEAIFGQLPGTEDLTLADTEAVMAAYEAYQALTEAQQSMLAETMTQELENAVSRVEELEKMREDLEKAEAVETMIGQLPAEKDLTLSDKAAVDAAYDAYQALTEAQKELVDTDAVLDLLDAREKMAALEEAHKKADAVADLIDQLPDAKDLTLADKEDVMAAYDAYNKLPQAQKDLISADAVRQLTDAVKKIQELEKAEDEEKEEENKKPVVPQCGKDANCILSQFNDITVTEWYHDGIHFCVEDGIMNGMGEGKFAPNENTTRAQLVMMLYRLAGTPGIEGKTEPFSDVADTDWFYAPIVWAYENKVVNGVSATEFAPNASVTREQVAAILHRYLGTPEGTGSLLDFPDATSVSGYAVEAMTWAVGEGLITGIAQADGTALLAPTGNATRAQIATILMRHLTK